MELSILLGICSMIPCAIKWFHNAGMSCEAWLFSLVVLIEMPMTLNAEIVWLLIFFETFFIKPQN
jgi:hypothetical protein